MALEEYFYNQNAYKNKNTYKNDITEQHTAALMRVAYHLCFWYLYTPRSLLPERAPPYIALAQILRRGRLLYEPLNLVSDLELLVLAKVLSSQLF